MAQFEYRAADAEGKIVEGTMEAAEVAAVVGRLHDRGLIPIRIGAAQGGRVRGRAAGLSLPALPWRRAVRSREVLMLTQELAALLGSGLPLDRSLATLAELAENPELKRVVSDILHAVQGGRSLAEALAQHPRVFPPLYVNMVRAGETGGFLDGALQRLAEYLERSQELRDEVRSALAYPTLLTAAMGLSLFVLLVYVLPRFAAIFAELGSALPLSASLVLAVSGFLRSYWWVLGVAVGGVVVGLRSFIASPRGRYAWDAWQLRLALVGGLLRKVEVARLARTLGTLLRSGVPMLHALDIVREVAGNQVIGRALGEVEVGVREGAGIAEPLGRSGILPPLALQMIAVGEETGRLDEMLLRVADHYDKEVRVQVRRLVALLEPALILVMGVAVGFVVLSMLSAIFSVNQLPI